MKLIRSTAESEALLIASDDQLRQSLLGFAAGIPEIVLLDSEQSGYLTIGLGSELGFVQFTSASGEPPYLIARGQTQTDNPSDEYMEFDSGGTPTPIALRYCLPAEDVVMIAVRFLNTGQLASDVNWDSI